MEYQHTAYREIVGERCAFCVTAWVDGARDEAGVRLTDLARRRLIAGLLARPHLILSGPAGAGKQRLAEALALSIAARRSSRVCLLQGHPWWAENTCDTSHYVNLQTQFSVWRLAHFTQSILDGKTPAFQDLRQASSSVRSGHGSGDYVVCVEHMSPAEIELYFRVVSESLRKSALTTACSAPIRLIGTFDSQTPPDLEKSILRLTAVVHLENSHNDATIPPVRSPSSNQE